jgi:uncharacterized membrane protein YeaQ/YmgE (transglycosylase-associated protein family)
MFNIVAWCIFGLVAGAIARFLLPGRDPMGCIATMILGIVGSVLGGYIGSLIMGRGIDGAQPAGWIMSIIGAIIALLIYRKMRPPMGT